MVLFSVPHTTSMVQLSSVMVQLSLPKFLLITATLLIASYAPVYAQSLTDEQLSVVTQRLAESANHSWEYGTRSQVLLEFNAPRYSVLSSFPVPPPAKIPSNLMIVSNRSMSNGNITGPQPLIQDTSAGDPASIGVAVLLANWTGQGAIDGLDYAGAAQDQLDFLFQNAPKTSDGAISHRMEQVQLWSDFVYMVPPFLAYYGAVTRNETLLQEAYTQISLYRNYLRDTHANNLWKHIQLGSGTDNGHWSTGNAWTAAGMLRVLGTIQQSQYANSFKSQQENLANWVQEIHSGIYPLLDSSGLFHNYADNSTTFLDASSTALLAGTVYRLSLLWGVHKYIPLAELSRKSLSSPAGANVNISILATVKPSTTTTSPSPTSSSASASSSTPDMLHITSDGWLTPVVDPYAYPYQGQYSPEGQAFVISMQAAWRDWVNDGSKGSSSRRGMSHAMGAWAVLLTGTLVAWLDMW
ncbi:hypothetical protein PAXINDRAFT_182676 [Paxillus involutus ATCC 200175]|uniref:Glycoside hydrolase family 105 protein n=1 Tax=Paxillus involutus ATCC 200175 TaxID=664439 RepID=A0A0C9SV74_PAXIN|nr:hypothetical protein PAXINDRAFT_182676 [Paxillus involutus ATCC 200175]